MAGLCFIQRFPGRLFLYYLPASFPVFLALAK
jgi:hypothetical protein